MTLHQFLGLVAIVAGLVALFGIGRALLVPRDREEDEWDEWDGGYDGELGPETVRLSQDPGTGEFARIPDEIPDEWDDESLASLHGEDRQSTTACCPRETWPDGCSCLDDCECLCRDCDCSLPDWNDFGPPTDERLERVVLALTESPEAWRARVEQESYEWRARMQGYFTDPIDFGQPLELAA